MLLRTANATTHSATVITIRSKLRSPARWTKAPGMVCNLVDLDGFVQREILDRFDLENLNTLAEFAQAVPTTENLCTAIYDILQRGFTHAHLEKVRIEETMMNSFEYAGAGRDRPLRIGNAWGRPPSAVRPGNYPATRELELGPMPSVT